MNPVAHPGSAPQLRRPPHPHIQPQKETKTALRYVHIEYQGNDIVRRDGQLPVTLLPRRVGLWVLRGQDHSCWSCQDTSTGSWRQSSKGMRLCLRETLKIAGREGKKRERWIDKGTERQSARLSNVKRYVLEELVAALTEMRVVFFQTGHTEKDN